MRGGLYDPVRNTLNMWSITVITIACAAQRCIFLINGPKATSFIRYFISS